MGERDLDLATVGVYSGVSLQMLAMGFGEETLRDIFRRSILNKLDEQVLVDSGASGNMRDLYNTTGLTSVTAATEGTNGNTLDRKGLTAFFTQLAGANAATPNLQVVTHPVVYATIADEQVVGGGTSKDSSL